MANKRFPIINLLGHTLTVDYDGIELKPYTTAATIYSGIVTSNEYFINVRANGAPHQAPGSLYIDSNIADSSHSVGVRLSGKNGILVFEGHQSNTFTGDVDISGSNTILYLNKLSGAVAIQGNTFINHGKLVFHRSQQLSKTSKITLSNNAHLKYIPLNYYSISNTLKELAIENGGLIDFDHTIEGTRNYNYNNYYITLDDLIINNRGLLTIKGWKAERDFILVRKNSQHLADALTKMDFEGYNSANIHLRNYNSDYWQISALPEPATYGALLGAASLGLWAWRRRKRHPHS